MTPPMPWMGRGGLAARDLRPEDVDDRMLHSPTARRVSPPRAGLLMGGPVIGHPHDHPMHDEGEPAFDPAAWSENPQLPDAIRLAEAGAPIEALALALRGDVVDERTLEFACDVLGELLGAEPLEEEGYEPVAALLSLSSWPSLPVRATACLSLLALDGPEAADLVSTLLVAEGKPLASAVNQVRARAGLQPLIWETGELAIEPGADDEDDDVEPDA